MEIEIKTEWNGVPIKQDRVKMIFEETGDGIKLLIDAPYHGDSPPDGAVGKPFWLLWKYEVVEAFFLNSETGEYLELEYGPHGQHLGLLFKKCREVWKKNLEMEFSAKIFGSRWSGTTVIPWDYFPSGSNKFNAFAIHGDKNNRVYEALYPANPCDRTKPDFHVLEYFKDLDVTKIFPGGKWNKEENTIWNDEK